MSDLSKFEEFPKLTFSELKHLQDDDVALCVNHVEAIQICKLSVEMDDVQLNEIQKLWLNKLLKAYNAVEFTYEHWLEVISFLDDLYKQLLGRAADDFRILTDINTWLTDCCQFMQWFQPLASSLNVACTCIVISYALKTVIGALQAYKQWSATNNLETQVENLLSIHNFVLKILNENIERWHLSSDIQFTSLTDVIALLCAVGEHSTPLIMKTIVETWRTIAKLATFCVKHSAAEPKDSQHQWVKRPMLFLINEIKHNMTVIYKEESLKQSIEQIEKFLRVTNFYLKLLRRLSSDFQHLAFPIIDEYWQALEQSKRLPKNLAASAIANLIDKYVCSALSSMMTNVYKHNAMPKLIADAANKDAAWFSIVQDYLLAIVTDKDLEFITNHNKNFVNLFNDIWTVESNFIEPSKYNLFIELFAALVVMEPSRRLKHLFFGNIMTSNFRIAFACSDVLTVAASLLVVRTKDLQHDFRNLRAMYLKFSLCTHNTKALLIAHLLRHCYQLSALHGSMHKELLEPGVGTSNVQLHTAIGSVNESVREQLHAEVIAIVDSIKLGDCKVDAYYRLVALLRLFATDNESNFSSKQLLFDKLYTLARKISHLPVNIAKHYAALLSAFLNIVHRNLRVLDAAYRLKLLELLQLRQKLCVSTAPVPYIQLISACRHNDNHSKQICEQIVVAASTQNTLIGILVNIFNEQPQNTQKLSLNVEYLHLYKFNNAAVSLQQHICADLPAIKRPRLCLSPRRTRDDDAKLLLNDLLESSNKLKQSATALDEHDKLTLNCVLNNLRSVLASKF